jgi:hypothetical protein
MISEKDIERSILRTKAMTPSMSQFYAHSV